MTDVYQTPESELTEFVNSGEYGSVETALLGQYDIDIGAILSEAWQKVDGNKGNFFVCSLVYLIAAMGIGFVTSIHAFFGIENMAVYAFLEIISQLASIALTAPLIVGMGMIGIRIAMGAPFSVGGLFAFYPKTLKLFLVYLVMSLLILLGLVALILPGIYLAVSYMFAMYLAADKDLGVWEALEVSRKAVSKKWFPIFGFGLVSMVIMVVASIPLFIGLIWVAPMLAIAFGIIYRDMFGVEAETLARQ